MSGSDSEPTGLAEHFSAILRLNLKKNYTVTEFASRIIFWKLVQPGGETFRPPLPDYPRAATTGDASRGASDRAVTQRRLRV